MYPHHHTALLHHSSSSSSSSSSSMIKSCNSAEVQPFMTRPSSPDIAPTTAQFKFLLNPFSYVALMLRSLFVPRCRPPASQRGKLTGTFFGEKKGRVSFAVQETPRSEPVLLLDLAAPTSRLVREMASGTVRILLECERIRSSSKRALLEEKVWTAYCNGHRLGYAVSRPCTASDSRVLGAVRAVSVGAGVMPPALLRSRAEEGGECCAGGEVMYMRARFERVIGSRDSEAFYMISPDCGGRRRGGGWVGSGGKNGNNGGPELSIFLLRI